MRSGTAHGLRAPSGRSATSYVPWLLVIGLAASIWQILVPTGPWSYVSYYLAVGGAAVIAAVAWATARPRPRVALLVTLALLATALGDTIWDAVVVRGGASPDVSIADIAWILSYAFVIWAVLAMLRAERSSENRDVDAVLDMAVVFIVVAMVAWELWVGPTLADDTQSLWVRMIWAAYPVLDCMMLALVFRLASAHPADRRFAAFLGVGMTAWLASDLGWLVLGEETPWAGVLNAGWMLGSVLLACAVLAHIDENRSPTSSPRPRSGHDSEAVTRTKVALVLTPFLVPWMLELAAYGSGNDLNPAAPVVATVALGFVTYLRMVRLIRQSADARGRAESNERLYRALTANSSDAVVVLDRRGRLVRESQGLRQFLDPDPAPELGRQLIDQLGDQPGCSQPLTDVFERSLDEPETMLSTEFCHVRRTGSMVWIEARLVNLLADPDVRGVVVNLHDITARRAAEDELAHRAFHDSLTGLPNRALLLDRLEHAISQVDRTGRPPAVLYIDLDGFKVINDTLGHDAGDRLLATIGDRLGSSLREGDTVSRLGGDEFVVLIEHSANPEREALDLADRFLDAIADPLMIEGHPLVVSASIGIAIGSTDSDGKALLRDADIAMYQAKAKGRGQHALFEPSMRRAVTERFRLETDLPKALDSGQLRLAYQPVVNLETGNIEGVEALLRWQHPDLGAIPPTTFIPIAESTGTILEIGQWVLRSAAERAAEWKLLRPGSTFTMAVNVSAHQLNHPGFVDTVTAALQQCGLPATSLVLEITETALIEHVVDATETLTRIRDTGVRVAIDDFGTGYSSLSYLQHLPVDTLKIDRSFLNTQSPGSRPSELVQGMLELARALGLEAIPEGIETPEQLEVLQRSSCERGQGFLFARPMSADRISSLLVRSNPYAQIVHTVI